MQLNEEEFNEKFTETLDRIIEDMAENPGIEPGKFFSMVCVLENLQYFSPIIYGALRPASKLED